PPTRSIKCGPRRGEKPERRRAAMPPDITTTPKVAPSRIRRASLVRDDMPWLYELAMEVYRAVKEGNIETIERELNRLHRYSEVLIRGPFFEELGFSNKEVQMFAMEFPRMLERSLMRTLEMKKAHSPIRQKVRQTLTHGSESGE
ncbi:hypothetical protein, partial [Pseudorhodoplanes sp.]|uniref:hypothetical protein n=1 Tax=Pseudorhodoplanes sp. TaxID=1934341 RepID=UPI003D0E47C9